MTNLQRLRPTDPSRCVDFDVHGDEGRGTAGGGSNRAALLAAQVSRTRQGGRGTVQGIRAALLCVLAHCCCHLLAQTPHPLVARLLAHCEPGMVGQCVPHVIRLPCYRGHCLIPMIAAACLLPAPSPICHVRPEVCGALRRRSVGCVCGLLHSVLYGLLPHCCLC